MTNQNTSGNTQTIKNNYLTILKSEVIKLRDDNAYLKRQCFLLETLVVAINRAAQQPKVLVRDPLLDPEDDDNKIEE